MTLKCESVNSLLVASGVWMSHSVVLVTIVAALFLDPSIFI